MNYILRRKAEADANEIREEWGALRWLASQAIGNAQGVTLGRVVIKPGESNPRHSHHNGEEVLYLLRGQLRHQVGEAWVTLRAGDVLSVPADAPHVAVNTGDVDADMIVAYSTGDRDFRVEEE